MICPECEHYCRWLGQQALVHLWRCDCCKTVQPGPEPHIFRPGDPF